MSEKKSRAQVKARLPKGLRDVEAMELRHPVRHLLGKISEVYERIRFRTARYTFVRVHRCARQIFYDQDQQNEGVFSFQDEDEQWVSLRRFA